MLKTCTTHLNKLGGLVMLIMWSLVAGQSVQAQAPVLPGWHSQAPINITKNVCYTRAIDALKAAGLSNVQTQDGWTASATNSYLRAAVNCIQVGQGTIVSVNVASLANYSQQANQMRDFLRDYMQKGETTTPNSSNARLWLDKNSFVSTEQIRVNFSGLPGNSRDWITLTAQGKADNQYGAWKYTESKKSGSLLFDPLPAGDYEARVYFNNSYKVEDRVSFVVRAASTGSTATRGSHLEIPRSVMESGEKFRVNFFNLPGNSTDWITVIEASQPLNKYGQWFYTQKKTNGSLEFNGLNPGNYEVRLFYNGSYKLEEKLPFRVEGLSGGNFLIRTARSVFSASDPIQVEFSNSQGADNDWIAICNAGSTDRQYGQWNYKGKLKAGKMDFKALPAGNYEIRYYLKGGYTVGKRVQIRVVP